MFPEQFTSLQFLQKKQDILLYRAKDSSHNYILKSIIAKDSSIRQAFYDEYSSLSVLSSPSIPIYYGINEQFHYTDREGDFLTLCMEDCSDKVPLSKGHYDLTQLLSILSKTGTVLAYLLDHGILYTDLNPSNILVGETATSLSVTLLDFTYCYYFLRNPNPKYPLRFSYDLTPSLKGQQLLIQEMTLLFHELITQHNITMLPFRVCTLLEKGMQPDESFSLQQYLSLLNQCLI